MLMISDSSLAMYVVFVSFFFFQAEDGIRDSSVTGVQTCALPISDSRQCFLRAGRSHLLRGLYGMEWTTLGGPQAARAGRCARHRRPRSPRRAIRESCRI